MHNRLLYSLFAVAAATLAGRPAMALNLGPDFAADYSATSLGSVPALPPNYGGLTLKAGDPDTLLIGGAANSAAGLLYSISVIRDAGGHITGFAGSASPLGTVGAYNDGGVGYGPGNVLFTAQWPVNKLGQTKAGNTAEDRVDDLTPLGIGGSSISAQNFVPTGFSGSGRFKVVSWSSGNWYDVSYAPDGAGTYNLTGATQVDLDPITPGVQSLTGGPEGFVYIQAGNAGFPVDSLLVAEYSAGQVAAYEVDAEGNPILTTRRVFISDLSGAEGAFIDPVTGDFFFSTFGGGNQVVEVSGFIPPTTVPIPAALPMLASAVAGLGGLSRRKA